MSNEKAQDSQTKIFRCRGKLPGTSRRCRNELGEIQNGRLHMFVDGEVLDVEIVEIKGGHCPSCGSEVSFFDNQKSEFDKHSNKRL